MVRKSLQLQKLRKMLLKKRNEHFMNMHTQAYLKPLSFILQAAIHSSMLLIKLIVVFF